MNAETGAKEGDLNAQKVTAQIYKKLGKKVPTAETLGAGKPGASEGEQMTNVALLGGGIGDAAKLIGGLREAVPAAVDAGRGLVARATAKRTIPGGARVVGKAAVKDARGAVRGGTQKALGPGRPALREAKAAPKAKAPDLDKTAKGTARKVNPRAAGTHPRAMGTNPRAVAARKAAASSEERAASKHADALKSLEDHATGKPAKGSIGKKAADRIREGPAKKARARQPKS